MNKIRGNENGFKETKAERERKKRKKLNIDENKASSELLCVEMNKCILAKIAIY